MFFFFVFFYESNIFFFQAKKKEAKKSPVTTTATVSRTKAPGRNCKLLPALAIDSPPDCQCGFAAASRPLTLLVCRKSQFKASHSVRGGTIYRDGEGGNKNVDCLNAHGLCSYVGEGFPLPIRSK